MPMSIDVRARGTNALGQRRAELGPERRPSRPIDDRVAAAFERERSQRLADRANDRRRQRPADDAADVVGLEDFGRKQRDGHWHVGHGGCRPGERRDAEVRRDASSDARREELYQPRAAASPRLPGKRPARGSRRGRRLRAVRARTSPLTSAGPGSESAGTNGSLRALSTSVGHGDLPRATASTMRGASSRRCRRSRAAARSRRRRIRASSARAEIRRASSMPGKRCAIARLFGSSVHRKWYA